MDGWGFASFKVIIGFHREGRKGSHAAPQPTPTYECIIKSELRDLILFELTFSSLRVNVGLWHHHQQVL